MHSEQGERMEVSQPEKRVHLISHKVAPTELRAGDHIYAYRLGGLYGHHGIYVGKNSSGEDMVIHFINTDTSEYKEPTDLADNDEQLTEVLGTIEKTTLDNFLRGAKPRLVVYGARGSELKVKRAGTVHTLTSRPAEEVVRAAEHYLEHRDEWGEFHYFKNNCEMFCIYCKTGEDDRTKYNDQNKGLPAVILKPLTRAIKGGKSTQ